MISDTYSHLREGDVDINHGIAIFFSGIILLICAIISYLKLYHNARLKKHLKIKSERPASQELYRKDFWQTLSTE